MPFWWIFAAASAFLLSVVLTDLVRLVAIKFNILDRPSSDRKKHRTPVPYLGGVAIFLSFSIVVFVVSLFSDHFVSGDIEYSQIIGLMVGGLVLIIGGAIDDKFELSPKVSILFPVIAALIAALVGIGPDKITNPLGGAFEIASNLAFFITFMWLLGMSYTTKLLDGVDGLATGIVAIGTLMIALLALSDKFFQPDVAMLAIIAFCALLGFLLWNFNPAQIFLGEGGSTYIGYLLGGLAIISGSKVATALLVVGIPILDIIFVVLLRYRLGKSLFKGDRLHLHFKLFDLGLSQRQVVILYYCIAIIFGLTTLIFESWQKIVALGVLIVIMFILVNLVNKKLKI